MSFSSLPDVENTTPIQALGFDCRRWISLPENNAQSTAVSIRGSHENNSPRIPLYSFSSPSTPLAVVSTPQNNNRDTNSRFLSSGSSSTFSAISQDSSEELEGPNVSAQIRENSNSNISNNNNTNMENCDEITNDDETKRNDETEATVGDVRQDSSTVGDSYGEIGYMAGRFWWLVHDKLAASPVFGGEGDDIDLSHVGSAFLVEHMLRVSMWCARDRSVKSGDSVCGYRLTTLKPCLPSIKDMELCLEDATKEPIECALFKIILELLECLQLSDSHPTFKEYRHSLLPLFIKFYSSITPEVLTEVLAVIRSALQDVRDQEARLMGCCLMHSTGDAFIEHYKRRLQTFRNLSEGTNSRLFLR